MLPLSNEGEGKRREGDEEVRKVEALAVDRSDREKEPVRQAMP